MDGHTREAAPPNADAVSCPRCGTAMERWINDLIELGRRLPPGEPVPHDHVWRCPRCRYEMPETEPETRPDGSSSG